MRQLVNFPLISVLLRCRHGILDKARLASKELMEHCTQSSGEVVLQISLLNSKNSAQVSVPALRVGASKSGVGGVRSMQISVTNFSPPSVRKTRRAKVIKRKPPPALPTLSSLDEM